MWRSNLALLLLFTLFLLYPTLSAALSSVNVPVGSRVYEDLERLEVKGLLRSSMLSTRPITRADAARLVSEARSLYGGDGRGAARGILDRLEDEFRAELRDGSGLTYLKPASDVRLEYLYSDISPHFAGVNNDGYTPGAGNSGRAGFTLHGGVLGLLSGYASPEWRLGEDEDDFELLHGYVKLGLGPLEVLAGRDSMWWGPGVHGAMLLSNNARPFDMVKVSTWRPVVLPSVLRPLGLFRPTVFLTALEDDRFVPEANVLGMRLDFKPAPFFQFGLSRVFMFGGEGRRHLRFSDWVDVFFASDSAEHTSDSPVNGNQIVSVDASVVYVSDYRVIPFSGIKLYTEWGAEDSSGRTKTPTGKANIIGAFVDAPLWLDGVDLRVEWANTARNERYGPTWYTHSVYRSGYTHEGRVIGHHVGGDSRDLFVRARYHAGDGVTFGVETDLEWSGIHGSELPVRERVAADVTYRPADMVTIEGGVGYEDIDDTDGRLDRHGVDLWIKAKFNI